MLCRASLISVGLACALALASLGCGQGQTSTSNQPGEITTNPSTSNSSTNSGLGSDLPSDDLVVPKLFDTQSLIGPLADAYRRIDPSTDGWDSEAFGTAASAQLNSLAHQFESRATDFAGVVSEKFAAPSLTANQHRQEAYRDEVLSVHRTNQTLAPATEVAIGPERMQELATELGSEFSDHPHVKFKLYRVDAQQQLVETMAYFHVDGDSPRGGKKEITANWKLTWKVPNETNPKPLIHSIQIEQFEVVETQPQQSSLFVDCTTSLLGSDEAYRKQLLYSTDHWRSRICRDYGLDVVANHGIAIGDVNGDMLEDVYVCQQGGIPNRLFIQQPDGTLKDNSANSNVDWLDYTASALLIDLDNDGDRDMVVGLEQLIALMRNDGSGKFQLLELFPTRAQTFSLAAADFDLDGDLDIYCCGYNNFSAKIRTGAMGEPIPYHDAQNGGPNLLLKNAGNWNFADATAEVGLEHNNNRFSFAASWEDYDNDGDPDLYVSNDYGRNNLYRNDNGKFKDIAAELNVQDMSAGMSISWGDMNRDGWMDFYVSNMFSAAGNRITYQRQFKDSISGEMKKQFQRHARGNSLFQSDGDGKFTDISETAGVTMGRWAWGSRFSDINNDGWLDILVNNGFISTNDTGDL